MEIVNEALPEGQKVSNFNEVNAFEESLCHFFVSRKNEDELVKISVQFFNFDVLS